MRALKVCSQASNSFEHARAAQIYHTHSLRDQILQRSLKVRQHQLNAQTPLY
jgi:hypothetical protein